jgi:hypothetical protein
VRFEALEEMYSADITYGMFHSEKAERVRADYIRPRRYYILRLRLSTEAGGIYAHDSVVETDEVKKIKGETGLIAVTIITAEEERDRNPQDNAVLFNQDGYLILGSESPFPEDQEPGYLLEYEPNP